MVKKITLDGNNLTFEDDVQATPRELDELTKGDFSAHDTRHEEAGADEVTPALHATRHQEGGVDEVIPALHDTRHEDGGADEIDITGLVGHQYGKNLILHSAFWDINNDDLPVMWTLRQTPTLVIAADTLFPSRGGNQITITNTGNTYEGIQIAGSATNWLKVLPSTTYAFSLDYKCTAGDFLNIAIQSFNDAAGGTTHINDSALVSTTAVRITKTLTTDADANNLLITFRAVNDGDICIVSHSKLEEGAIATPYILNEAEEQANIIQHYKPYARAYLNLLQENIANNTWTKVLLDTESIDLGSNFDVGNNKFVTPITGIYRISGQVKYNFADMVADKAYGAAIYVNGASASEGDLHSARTAVALSVPVHHLNKINETIDIELYAKQISGGALIDINTVNTFLEIELVTLDI